MITGGIAVIGAGPAGLSAALAAAQSGARVTVMERNGSPGGQLLKQTHKFFGSAKQHASVRGIDIAHLLLKKLEAYKSRVEILSNTTVLGFYEDGVLTAEKEKSYIKLRPDAVIAASGASEKCPAFPNNDLPGIYGAGAVQTLMNQHGVLPGKNAVMLGAGNIGLIVSYQLLQAGVKVKAVIDAAPRIGGYLVHAAKIRRAGVPILTSTTVKYARGTDFLSGLTLCSADEAGRPVPGTESNIEADVLCVAVGLAPLTELLWQRGCKMVYVSELGGYVPQRDPEGQTSIHGIYVAGDAGGIEEASSAMAGGRLAGLCAAKNLGFTLPDFEKEREDCLEQLRFLRGGPAGEKIRKGLIKASNEAGKDRGKETEADGKER